MENNNYWVSWYAPRKEGFELYFPWWVSGYVCDENQTETICAAIKASNELRAMDIIFDAYDSKDIKLEFRFVNEQVENWSPFCERFPKADWMKWNND